MAATTGRIGVEFEFGVTEYDGTIRFNNTAARLGLDDRADAVGYNHNTYRNPVFKHDSSCGSDGAPGSELVTPPLYRVMADEAIPRWLRIAREADLPVNHNCGLHVHVGVLDPSDTPQLRNVGSVYRQLHQDFLVNYLPQRRTTGGVAARYCSVDADGWATKYSAVNFRPLSRYGTIEFRQHHGTRRTSETLRWIDFVSAVTSYGASYGEITSDLRERVLTFCTNPEDVAGTILADN